MSNVGGTFANVLRWYGPCCSVVGRGVARRYAGSAVALEAELLSLIPLPPCDAKSICEGVC